LQTYREALESHNAPIVIINAEGKIFYLNSSAHAMSQAKSPKDLVGKPATSAGFPWQIQDDSLAQRLTQGENTTFFQLDGKSYACEAAMLRDHLGRDCGVLEYVRTEGDWVYDEGVDPLTGIADKARFIADTRRLIDCNPNERYAIVYWGVVRFRLINDVFSTTTGDRVLKNIAETIQSFVGDMGTCGRYGNDSFTFCMPRKLLNADWFKRHSEVTLMSDTAMYTFNSTYGVYEVSDRSCPVEKMCERAAYARSTVSDTHAAEGACYAFYDDTMHENISEEQELVSELSYALASNQVKVYFQPIYDISTGHVASAEALARWEHPEKGLIFPGRFIHLFETNGMVTELDKHIWNQVGVFQKKRLENGQRTVPVSINVSRVDFFATTLMDDLDEIVESHNLPRELLRLEVTESAYTDDPRRIIETIGKLRERGHTVLLDDFGSGYSSLNTLKDMPIDILKLDMSFLRDFDTDVRTRHIISHIVAMAHDLGHKVVAEGVETQEQVDFLRSVHCQLAQGFFYARPLPEAKFVELLDGQTADDDQSEQGLS